jgi:hypothetical protein
MSSTVHGRSFRIDVQVEISVSSILPADLSLHVHVAKRPGKSIQQVRDTSSTNDISITEEQTTPQIRTLWWNIRNLKAAVQTPEVILVHSHTHHVWIHARDLP